MALRIAGVLTILAGLVFVLTFSPSTAPPPIEATAESVIRLPQFQWVQLSSKDFALGPGESMGWELQTDRAKLRFELEASHPVAFRGQLHTVTRADFHTGACSAWQVFRETIECQQENRSTFPFVVADTRDEFAMLKGLGALWVKSSAAFEEASKTNRVRLTIREWKCVANCDLLRKRAPTSSGSKNTNRR